MKSALVSYDNGNKYWYINGMQYLESEFNKHKKTNFLFI